MRYTNLKQRYVSAQLCGSIHANESAVLPSGRPAHPVGSTAMEAHGERQNLDRVGVMTKLCTGYSSVNFVHGETLLNIAVRIRKRTKAKESYSTFISG